VKIISDLILRAALLVLVAPALPVTDGIGSLFSHVSGEIGRVVPARL
jgi:hypothetical protein